MSRWERWLLSRVSRTVRQLSDENRRLREYQAEASETIRAIYQAEQRWKAEAQRLKAQQSHPSCRGVMPDDQIREFDAWLASLPTVEEE